MPILVYIYYCSNNLIKTIFSFSLLKDSLNEAKKQEKKYLKEIVKTKKAFKVNQEKEDETKAVSTCLASIVLISNL